MSMWQIGHIIALLLKASCGRREFLRPKRPWPFSQATLRSWLHSDPQAIIEQTEYIYVDIRKYRTIR